MIYNVFTDGSCNQGSGELVIKGAWAFVVVDEKNNMVISDTGLELNTTNNRCEMLAIVNAIKAIKKINTTNDLIKINCDSAYIVNAFNDGWIEKWMSNGWINSRGESVLNQDYWNSILEEKKELNLVFNKIKRKNNSLAKKVDLMAREKMRS